MADYTVTITLTGDNFNYEPGYLQVHGGDRVQFKCNQATAFTIKFLYGTPFASTSGFSKNSTSTPTAHETIDPEAARQAYHYTVSATDSNGIIHVDGGCPTIEVV